jgi:acyl-CoA synthetase (AMP-forming)/AMP-acid ligase II
MGIHDVEWGQRVTAMVTLVPNSTVDHAELTTRILEHCKSRMASYKKPKDLRIVAEFPLNSTGKIAKKVLKQQLEAEGK